jgi:hypothetical protein
MKTELQPQIAKLPKWAQDHIRDLERQREVAIKALDDALNTQTESPFYTEDFLCLGEQRGPTTRRRHFQAHRIIVEWRGIRLDVKASDYGNGQSGIGLQWTGKHHRTGDIAFIPTSYQAASLVAPEDMRK